MEMNLLQVEYEQLWNVEDRSSRRLSSSEEEDTEEEAPGISSSPLQVNIGRKNKITDQNFKYSGGWSCLSTTSCETGELRSKDSANPCQKGGVASSPSCKTRQVARTLILTRLVLSLPCISSSSSFTRPASVQTWRHFALLAFCPPALLPLLPRPALL